MLPLAYALEAINQREMHVENAFDAQYLLAYLNLLNRYVEEDRTEQYLTKRDLYTFKRRAAQVLEVLVAKRYANGKVWIADDVTYACMFGLSSASITARDVPPCLPSQPARKINRASGQASGCNLEPTWFSIGRGNFAPTPFTASEPTLPD